MKSETNIVRRLNKLHRRYLGQYIKKSQCRTHTNCKYNRVHTTPTNISSKPTDEMRRRLPVVGRDSNMFISPDRAMTIFSNNLVIIDEKNDSIRVCAYNIDNHVTWNGDICDSDRVAESCRLFEPLKTVKEANDSFNYLITDDDYVYENYRDIATLQWVLEDRIQNWNNIFTIIYVWFLSLFVKPNKPSPSPILNDEELDTVWDKDDDQGSNSI